MSDSVRLYQSDDVPQLLSENGGIMLRDFNPKALLRFTGRKCVTCGNEIMDHWLRAPSQEYYCSKDGMQISEGITDCVYDVPEGFGLNGK